MSTTQTTDGHRTGHCLCGAISYTYDGESEAVVLCHCGDCQRHTGSAFSVMVTSRSCTDGPGRHR